MIKKELRKYIPIFILVALVLVILLIILSIEVGVGKNLKNLKKTNIEISERCIDHNGVKYRKQISAKGPIVLYLCNDHSVEW